MSSKPPKIVIPGLNRGAGIPAGSVVGRLPGTGQGPAQLLQSSQLRKLGVAQTVQVTGAISQSISVVQSEITSLSTVVGGFSGSISTISSSLSGAVSSTTSLSTAVSGVDSSQSTSLSQISSSLSGAISSTTSLSGAVSTVISGSISTVNSRIDSLSTAVGGGGGTPGGSNGQVQYNNAGAFGGFTFSGDITVVTSTGVATIAGHAVSNAKFRQSGALAIVGNSTNATADVADITATAASNNILREKSSALQFDSVTHLLDDVFGSTQGNILVRGASNWTSLAAGSSGLALVSNGAGATPSYQAVGGGGGGGLILLQQQTASTSANLDFTSYYSANYDTYYIELIDITPSITGLILLLRCSTDGGGTWTAGTSYQASHFAWSSAGSAVNGVLNASAVTVYPLNPRTMVPTSTSANQGMCGWVKMYNQSGFYTQFLGEMLGPDSVNTGTTPQALQLRGFFTSSTIPNGLRFFVASGGFSGIIRIYGVTH